MSLTFSSSALNYVPFEPDAIREETKQQKNIALVKNKSIRSNLYIVETLPGELHAICHGKPF